MANTLPIPFEQVDLSKITLKKPSGKAGAKDNKYGEILNLRYNDGPLRIILPDMEVAFNVKLSDLSGKLSACMSFKGVETSESLKRFREFLRRLDERIRTLMIEFGAALYPKDKAYKKTAPELIKQRYKGCVKSSQDEDGNAYPDRFDLNIQRSAQDPDRFKDFLGKSFIVDKKDKPIDVTVTNIGTVMTRGTKFRIVAEGAYVFAKHLAPFDTTLKFSMIHGMKMSSTNAVEWSLKNPNEDDEESDDADSTAAQTGASDKGEEVEYVEQEVTDSEDDSTDEQVEASA